MNPVQDPRGEPGPVRALRQCSRCGFLVKDAVPDGKVWVCQKPPCVASAAKKGGGQ